MNNLFKNIDFETISTCNRVCPTCIRNSHPDREAIESWFVKSHLAGEIIVEALDQCVQLGFTGGVCLSHYNEPLLDKGIVDIAKLVRQYDQFYPIFLNTNGDYLTKELAWRLDGVLDKIIVTLYMDEPVKSKRKEWIQTLFNITHVEVLTMSDHIPTHFSPGFDVVELANKHKGKPCSEPQMRVIINHRRQFLLCCDDVVGNFDLGTFPETSIADYWYGEKHMEIMETLKDSGGRLNYSYCSTCPRT